MEKISEKKYNYYKKKRYRYKRLNLELQLLETEIPIAIYELRFLDAIDYINELHNIRNKYYNSLYLILKNHLENKKSEEKINIICNKNLIDLTEEEAREIGGNTLKEFYYIEDKLCKFLSSKINKATVINCDTLRDLMQICKPYMSKK